MKRIPALPLLSIRDLIFPKKNISFSNIWQSFSEGGQPVYFSLGRHCFIEAIQKFSRDKYKKKEIWFPSFFCDETLAPIRGMMDTEIRFYPIRSDLSPDWSKIQSSPSTDSQVFFVLVHYFGFPNENVKAYEFCKTREYVLIEDCAHVLKPFKQVGSYGDIVIFSPRKLLEIPDGAILIVREKLDILPERSGKNRFKFVFLWMAKSLVKRLIWKFSFLTFSKRKLSFKPPIGKGFVSQPISQGITKFSKRYLNHLETSFDDFSKIRRKNYLQIYREVNKFQTLVTPLFPELLEDVTPYFFPFFVPEKERNKIIVELRSYGIPASTWPDLPPEIIGNNDFSMANQLYSKIITLPIHHRLTSSDMDYICEILNKLFSRVIENVS